MLFKGFDLNRLKQLKPVYVTEATAFLHTCKMQERKKTRMLAPMIEKNVTVFSSYEQHILLVLKEAVPKNKIPEKIDAIYFCFLKKHIYNIQICLYNVYKHDCLLFFFAAAIKKISRNSIKKEHERYKDGEEGKGDVKK